jgi:hypothetical protein
MLATSCGRPRRPSGTLPANSNAPALKPPPGTAPGASALTPMPATQRASKLLHHHRLAGFGGRKVHNVARPRRMQRGDEEHATLDATSLGDRLHASPELACKTEPMPSYSWESWARAPPRRQTPVSASHRGADPIEQTVPLTAAVGERPRKHPSSAGQHAPPARQPLRQVTVPTNPLSSRERCPLACPPWPAPWPARPAALGTTRPPDPHLGQ